MKQSRNLSQECSRLPLAFVAKLLNFLSALICIVSGRGCGWGCGSGCGPIKLFGLATAPRSNLQSSTASASEFESETKTETETETGAV